MIFPFKYAVNGSIVSENNYSYRRCYIIPKSISFGTYRFLFREGSIINAFFTSIKRLLIGVPFAMILTILLAYAMSKKDMPGRKALMAFVIFMMYFDGGLVPQLVLYKDLGLYDNFWVYILPAGLSVYNALLLRNFFDTIPESLSESAVIDGASESRILFQIVLPLSKPGIATIALFVAVAHWNDWFTGIAFMRQTSPLPLQTYLRK